MKQIGEDELVHAFWAGRESAPKPLTRLAAGGRALMATICAWQASAPHLEVAKQVHRIEFVLTQAETGVYLEFGNSL
jgi:hypothetical protein